MGLSLDHVVIAVRDLDRTIADYTALGFTVTVGGEHTGGASHNALIDFADGAYIELIAFKRPNPEFRWWRVLDEAGDGFVDYALLPGDIAADVAAAKARGLDLDGPNDGGRLRPDGVRLDWRTARASTSDLPFLCGDVTPRALRVPEGDVRRHANGVVGVAAIEIAVENPQVSAWRYGALLGTPADAAAPIALGNASIRLAGPERAAAALAARGEAPVSLLLRTAPGSATGDFDPALSHGARLTRIAE
ncbi:catechol 2,3-dioxygenase-like lactoylglutathione lyase family enzyme [Inquilinus ginsengisoli]|uniref:Catechol 2,3-dioxygenase-like lactoylglutathione lyase family enzyme n=1 Tax=Inquilinus ginsengisoli TaxID=363840 RepID=A0ABU1JK66_9PROT|nr:VOC family protein [Inquilinus ginsengisoli]MDR6289007.1 catechol 2,3-dioxygenase-like lactoylglutathione lyase family enzyme [Inquilinus ginsengisoli]